MPRQIMGIGDRLIMIVHERPALETAGLDGQGKSAAITEAALDGDITTEHLSQPLGDGQSQTGAAEAAGGGGIGLSEGTKELRKLLLRHADAAEIGRASCREGG